MLQTQNAGIAGDQAEHRMQALEVGRLDISVV